MAIDIKGVLLLLLVLGACAAVDVYHMQCFCVLNHKVGPLLYGNHFSERALDLSGDLEVVKDRIFVFVELNNLLLFRRYERDVFARLVINGLIVHINVCE